MSADSLQIRNLDKIKEIFDQHGVAYAGIFGSHAKGNATENSDIDMLIEYADDAATLFEFIELKQLLEDTLGRKVDLVTRRGLNRYLKDDVLNSLISIYERQ